MEKNKHHVEEVKYHVPWSRFRTDTFGCGETLSMEALPEEGTIDLDDPKYWEWTYQCPAHTWGENIA